MPVALDSHLGPYQLRSHLGSGGMGEVYRARDTRLQRDVAIKIVSTRNAPEDTRRRFEHEARAASALNHPNIVTVHDVGHSEEMLYIVSELIEGEPLRGIISRGPLPMAKVLDYGVQIADGLAAAHEAGIVHRDLKPENIMIARSGRVKILDFGIAKFEDEEPWDSARTLGNGDAGQLIGTTAYMSPEQARGGRINYYADQFALGLILYEMATGEAAFKRDNPLQTLSAVLTEDPPALHVGSEPFRWLVKRCLHKEPDHRYRSTTDLLRELENIRAHLTDPESLEAPPTGTVAPTRRQHRAQTILFWAAALALAALAGYFVATRWHTTLPVDIGQQHFAPFATSAAIEAFPAWAPNGRTLAYSADVDGVLQIFTRSVNTPAASQLTSASQSCLFPFWSPDSARIYYNSGGQLWAVGATGGTPEVVLENAIQAAIAADGKTVAALRATAGSNLFNVALGTLGSDNFRSLETRSVLPWSYLHFSPDGKKLAAWVSHSDGRSELLVFPTSGGSPKRELEVLSSSPLAREFSWLSDSARIVYSDRTALSLGSHLYIADLRTGGITQLTNGTASELSPSVSPNGRTVAFTSLALDYDVVRITWSGQIQPLLTSTRFEVSPTISSDGRYAYVTDRSGVPEIWLRAGDGSSERTLVTPESFGEDRTGFLFDLVFSPDGKRLAYRRSGSDQESIWVSPVSGGSPVRLAKEPGQAFQRGPSWSPDGNSVVYFSLRDGKYVLVRARVGGLNDPEVVAENAGTYPRWSPRGDWIAALGPGDGITIVSPDGQKRTVLGTGEWLLHGWSRDGSTIYGIKRLADKRMVVASVRVADRSETVLSELGKYPADFTLGNVLGSMPLRGFSLSPDDSGFVTSVLRADADIWTMQRSQGGAAH